jgi:hypothetical protein
MILSLLELYIQRKTLVFSCKITLFLPKKKEKKRRRRYILDEKMDIFFFNGWKYLIENI